MSRINEEGHRGRHSEQVNSVSAIIYDIGLECVDQR